MSDEPMWVEPTNTLDAIVRARYTGKKPSSVHDLVAADLEHRKQIGLAEYGVELTADNGRDHLWDLYEELLDAACYLRAEIERRNNS